MMSAFSISLWNATYSLKETLPWRSRELILFMYEWAWLKDRQESRLFAKSSAEIVSFSSTSNWWNSKCINASLSFPFKWEKSLIVMNSLSLNKLSKMQFCKAPSEEWIFLPSGIKEALDCFLPKVVVFLSFLSSGANCALETFFSSGLILSIVLMISCCSYNIPHTPGKGVYKPENFVKFFLQKYTPNPCNYFCENGFLKIVQLMNIWMSLFKI